MPHVQKFYIWYCFYLNTWSQPPVTPKSVTEKAQLSTSAVFDRLPLLVVCIYKCLEKIKSRAMIYSRAWLTMYSVVCVCALCSKNDSDKAGKLTMTALHTTTSTTRLRCCHTSVITTRCLWQMWGKKLQLVTETRPTSAIHGAIF